MKLSKALLGAIVIGIGVQATSCKKEDIRAEIKAKKESGKQITMPYGCPACGMG